MLTLDLKIGELAAAHERFLDTLFTEAETAVRDFAAETLPELVKAVGPETEGQGKGAIIADLFKVVTPVKPQNESKVIINPNSVRWLMSRRRYHGKVRRALKSKHPVRLADFNSYRDQKFKNIGIAGSGYAAAARELGVALPGWMMNQREGEGTVGLERRGRTGLSLSVINAVEWVYWLPDTRSKSGYAVQRKAGRYYDHCVKAWDRAKGKF